MPTKFFEELIGRKCEIMLRDDESEEGTLQAVDGDWLKLHSDYGRTLYINAKQVIFAAVEDERDDRESRWGRRKRM